jgi:hypothetical protein
MTEAAAVYLSIGMTGWLGVELLRRATATVRARGQGRVVIVAGTVVLIVAWPGPLSPVRSSARSRQ